MQVRFQGINSDVLGRVMDYALLDVDICRLVCRSWYRAAKGKGCLSIVFGEDTEKIVKRIAGLGLQKMVGYDWFPVVRLDIDLRDIEDLSISFIRTIAGLVGPALFCLTINNNLADYGREEEPEFFFEILSIFFENCPRIKSLYLDCFDFGSEPFPFLSDVIRSGMSRLLHLKINSHDGALGVIVENISIRLISFEYCRYDIHDLESVDFYKELIAQIARCYPTLESLVLECDGEIVIEPSKVLDVVKKFKDLKRLEMIGNWDWSKYQMRLISQIPLLKSLKIGGFWTDEMIEQLAKSKSIKSLYLSDKTSTRENPVYLFSLLRGIGRQLRSLTLHSRISHELTLQIPNLCPKVEYLLVSLPKGCVKGMLEKRFRSAMKRLGAVCLPN
jgi:hypothetical protein